MKTQLLGLFCLGLTNLMIAQNDLAVLNTSQNNYITTKSVSKNVDYKIAVDSKDMSKYILKFQNLVANYNIKSESLYNEKRAGTYTVTFREGKSEIIAEYNNEGKIITCNESYSDIKLPYAISSKIVKENPEWKMKTVTCEINYSKDQTEIAYQVLLKKGNKSKRLKIKA